MNETTPFHRGTWHDGGSLGSLAVSANAARVGRRGGGMKRRAFIADLLIAARPLRPLACRFLLAIKPGICSTRCTAINVLESMGWLFRRPRDWCLWSRHPISYAEATLFRAWVWGRSVAHRFLFNTALIFS